MAPFGPRGVGPGTNTPLKSGPLSRKAPAQRWHQRSWSGLTEQRWTSFGPSFLYTAANWGAVTWYLEAYFRATSAKALVQLYDNTAATFVANSLITVDGVYTFSRQRSLPLTFVDGHEYQVQFGNQDQGAGAFLSAKLIAI